MIYSYMIAGLLSISTITVALLSKKGGKDRKQFFFIGFGALIGAILLFLGGR